MPYARTNLEDTYGEDYADLDSILEHDGRFTPGSNHSLRRQGYRISFRSIDDEELQRVMRSLTTPVPSTRQTNHHDDDLQQYKQRPDDAHSLKSGSSRGYHDRSESVMLFRKLNRGDDEVSLDLVSSELKDFIDPSLLEDTMSRPASRTPSTPKKPYDESFEQQQEQHLKQQQQQQQQPRQPQQQHLRQPSIRNDRKHSLDARLVNNNSRQSMIDRRRSVAVVESEDGKEGRMNAMLNKSARKTEELLQAIRRTSFIRDSSEPVNHAPKHYTSLRTNPTTTTAANLNKRQSMDLEVLLALKKDTDAILERRASLLSKARPNNRPIINDGDDDPHQMRRGSTNGGEQNTSFEHRYHHQQPRMRSTPRSKLSSSDDDAAVVRDQMTSTLSSNTTTTTSSDTSSASSSRRVRTVSMPEKHRLLSSKTNELPFEEPVVNLRSRASRNMMIRNRESRPSPSSSSITLSRVSDSLPETPPESVVEEIKPYSSNTSSFINNTSTTSTTNARSSSSYRSSRRVTVCDPAVPNLNQQQSLPRTTRNRSSTLYDDQPTASLRSSRRNTVSSARPNHQIPETTEEEPSVAEMANDILTSIRQRHSTTTTTPRSSTARVATTRERSSTLSSGSSPSRYSSSVRSRRMTVSGNDSIHDDDNEDYGLKLSSNSATRRYSSRPSQHHQSTVLYRLPHTRHRESFA